MDIAIGRWNELFRYPAIELFEIAEVEKQIHAHEFESTFRERVGFQKSNIKKNKNILLNVIIVLLSSLHFYRWTFFIICILIYINIYNPFGFRYISFFYYSIALNILIDRYLLDNHDTLISLIQYLISANVSKSAIFDYIIS